MDILRILPFEGLNTIKLGMTQAEIAAILGPPVDVHWEDCMAYDDINYTISFRNDRAWEICVNNYSLSDRYRVMLHDVDLFGDKAEDVIRKLERFTPCTYEGGADKDLAFGYTFPIVARRRIPSQTYARSGVFGVHRRSGRKSGI